MEKTTYDKVMERINQIPDKEGLPKDDYDKALGIKE